MDIKSIESFIVRIPYDESKPKLGGGYWSADPLAHPGLMPSHPGDVTTEYPPLWRSRAVYPRDNQAVVVRLETDTGLVGWGEAHAPIAGEVVKVAVDTLLTPVVYKRDPRDLHPLWEAMYSTMRVRGHNAGFLLEAISAVDIALHDLAGKAMGVPAAALLGGAVRDKVPVYASSLPRLQRATWDADSQRLIEMARGMVDSGFRAVKVKLGIDLAADTELLRQLRAEVGSGVGIAVDVNGAYDEAMARRAGEQFADAAQIMWLEEPLPPEHLRNYKRLAAFLHVPVAGGETVYGRWAFNEALAMGAFDIIQPDVGRAGGIGECKRISDLADIFGVPFAPHISTGTAITRAAALQWAAAAPNLMSCEWSLYQDAADKVTDEPFALSDGFVTVPDKPGLGIEIDEAALRRWEAA